MGLQAFSSSLPGSGAQQGQNRHGFDCPVAYRIASSSEFTVDPAHIPFNCEENSPARLLAAFIRAATRPDRLVK
jgi:hypothetical protein